MADATDTADTQVLVAGAGPVGLTAAIELRARGVDVRIVDQLPEPQQYAKAVGVQPRTLEIWEGAGILRRALDEATPFRGQVVYAEGEEVGRLDIPVLPDVPFGFVGIPQYATEAVLRDRLAELGTTVERGVRLTGFEQDDTGVTATLETAEGGRETVRAAYLVGADGAHSVVRKALGLTYDGGAFDEQYMLGDVEVDWSLPHDVAVRASRRLEDGTTDLLVCIPLKGDGRYRMSMLVPAALATAPSAADGVEHGFEGSRKPRLEDIQAVLDRLSPEPTTARTLRWSSVFRISHRIVDRYRVGRAFVAGDAAHIHPPTGAQGMNTGIQDAHNLGWKLALDLAGHGSADLLDSYDAERRPVGEEVVGRTVTAARQGIGSDSDDPTYVVRREAQLLISYAGSPLVGGRTDVEPAPGDRAPDARGLTRVAVTDPVRLYAAIGRTHHTLLLHAGPGATADQVRQLEAVAHEVVAAAHGQMDAYVVADPTADTARCLVPVLVDSGGGFAAAYHPEPGELLVLRPDGHLGHRGPASDRDGRTRWLRATFA